MEANGIQRENIRMQGGLPISIRLHKIVGSVRCV